jgi:ubiquinone/menaquinone biosynthesis C-methylase UbiE
MGELRHRKLNYFDSQDAAERYSSARPYFHPPVIKKVKDFIGLDEPVPKALDVACGTGESTLALKEIARDNVGVDSSEKMLALAPKDDRIRYLRASAEGLPYSEAQFDLITVSKAIHWFERDSFLAEASRVLSPSGCLIVYGFRSGGGMKYVPEYDRWFDKEFSARYPTLLAIGIASPTPRPTGTASLSWGRRGTPTRSPSRWRST